MRRFSAVRRFRVSQLLAFVFAVALSLPVSAHESEIKTPDPGFRPHSEYAPAFLEALDTTTIAVYPSLVRRANRTAHSFASQSQIIAFLNAENIATAVAAPYRIDLGALPQVPQWDLFLNDMWRIAYLLTDHQFDSEYHLFMEFLFPVNNQAVFGIECYVLDRNGENAFSFLLNSHHRLFVDAKLVANNSSEAARAKLLEKATQVGVTAFKRQLEQAKESAAATAEIGPADLRDGPSTEQDPCIGEAKSNYAINELPMYGHLKKTAAQKRAREPVTAARLRTRPESVEDVSGGLAAR